MGCSESEISVGSQNLQNHTKICYSCFKTQMKTFQCKNNFQSICQKCVGYGVNVCRNSVHNYPCFIKDQTCCQCPRKATVFELCTKCNGFGWNNLKIKHQRQDINSKQNNLNGEMTQERSQRVGQEMDRKTKYIQNWGQTERYESSQDESQRVLKDAMIKNERNKKVGAFI